MALVQAKAGEAGNAPSIGIAMLSAVTSGNFLIVGVGVFGETTANVSVTDTLGNTWTKVFATWQPDNNSGIFLNYYCCVSASGGTDTITVKVTPSVNGFWGAAVAEHNGLGTPTFGVQGGAAAALTNPYNGPAFTPSAGSLLVAFMADEGNSETLTAGAGWTKAASASTGVLNNCMIHVLSSTASSIHGIWGTGTVGAAGSIYLEIIPGSSGTTHTQTLSVAQTTTPTLLKQIGKPLARGQTSTASLTRQTGKGLSVTQATTAALSRAIGKTVTVAQSSGASLTRQTGKALSVTQSTTASLVKQIGKLLTRGQGTTATLTSTRVKVLVLTVTQASTAIISRQVGKILSISQTTTPTITRQVGKLLSISQASAATLVKQVGKRLALIQSTTATLGTVKVKIIVLSVVQTTAATMTRQVGKTISLGQATSAGLSRLVGKGLSVTQATTAGMGKQIGKALAVVQATVASSVTARVRLVALAVAQSTTAGLSRQIGKALAVSQSTTPLLTKSIAKMLSVVQASASVLTALKNPGAIVQPIRAAFRALARATAFRSGRGLSPLGTPAPTQQTEFLPGAGFWPAPQAPPAQGGFMPGAGFMGPVYLPLLGYAYRAAPRTTRFISRGDVDMPAQPVVSALQPPVLRSGDAGEVFELDFGPDLATGEALSTVSFTVLGASAAQLGSQWVLVPGASWADVTTTVAPGAVANPSAGPTSGTALGTVATNTTTSIASLAHTTGLGPGTVGTLYRVVYYVTTTTGRKLSDFIDGVIADI